MWTKGGVMTNANSIIDFEIVQYENNKPLWTVRRTETRDVAHFLTREDAETYIFHVHPHEQQLPAKVK